MSQTSRRFLPRGLDDCDFRSYVNNLSLHPSRRQVDYHPRIVRLPISPPLAEDTPRSGKCRIYFKMLRKNGDVLPSEEIYSVSSSPLSLPLSRVSLERVTLLPDSTFARDCRTRFCKPPSSPPFRPILSLFFFFVSSYFRPLRNASPENYVSSCDCCDGAADDGDDDGAPDVASEHRSPAGSDGLPGGRGCP